jgi:hypothetical protein
MNKIEIYNYAKNMEINPDVIAWLEKTEKDWVNQEEIEHIIDYLASNKRPKKLERATYIQMKTNSKKWSESLQKKGCDYKETEKDIEVIKTWNRSFKFVKLKSERAYEREGKLMRHCVISYFDKNDEIYSLRDKNNQPHCTISKSSQQIKGKGNGSIHPKYIKYVVEFLEFLGINVRDSEMKNLGYINVSSIVPHLHKETISKLFKKKYIKYPEIKMLNKNKEEYCSLTLFSLFGLIKKNKILFELEKFIPNLEELKLDSSGNGSKLASSGDNSKLASSGDNSKLASSGNGSKLASSGYDSELASSGNYSKLASSGNYSKLASSGNGSELASSGYDSELASSGDNSKLASSGNYSKLASSGNGSKLASSGYDSELASSGDNSKLASSGDNSKLASSGKWCVCANIGINGKIKAKKGTWITLAEYDSGNICVFVKSAKIDNIKLKEDVWYKLKNKEFIKVKENE